jgi:hypothetical protein
MRARSAKAAVLFAVTDVGPRLGARSVHPVEGISSLLLPAISADAELNLCSENMGVRLQDGNRSPRSFIGPGSEVPAVT